MDSQGGQDVSILTFVMMLAASAGNYLEAAVKKEDAAEKKQDLSLARMTIDLLGVLDEKTSGNLTDEEKKILEDVLAGLRMQYVRLSG